ncbi:MAG: DUF4132 domain-containing protein [Armatimonadetes bacterium]|nr:DUF4132 domain-containing protein [Armatimonadota bacterium]
MLTPEEAKTRLEQFKRSAWVKERATLAKKLPGGARDIADALGGQDRALLAMFGSGKKREAALKALTELSDGDRRALFTALWPQMVPAVEQAWQLIGRGVYETGWIRRSFRAPTAPTLYANARFRWLFMLASATEEYNVGAPWLAAWGPHLASGQVLDQTVGLVLAGAIDAGGAEGEEVLRILIESANGEHEIGVMGEHVIRALITCSRPEGWECVERLLLAAQREEGLRQSILERIDEAHPECFRRLLRLILDHGLARFSATIRAADVWFGFGYEALAQREVEQAIGRTLAFQEDDSAREAALAGDDPGDFHLALWTLAFSDAVAAIERAKTYLVDDHVEKRFVAAKLLQTLGINVANRSLIPALSDEDLRVAVSAAQALMHDTEGLETTDLFERLEALVPRLPAKKTTLPALVYPWWEVEAISTYAAYPLIECRGKRPIERIIPLATQFDPSMRRHLVDDVKKGETSRPKVRAFLLDMLGDASADVRSKALDKLKGARIEPSEAQQIEALLTRKATDLRRACLQLLLNQADAAALASAERLTGAKDALQRLAGLELLRELATAQREADRCRAVATAYRESRDTLTADEQAHIDHLAGASAVVLGPENGFGLYDPATLTPGVEPRRVLATLATPAAHALIKGLLAKLAEHAETPVTFDSWEGPRTEPLASAYPSHGDPVALPAAERTADKLPLMDVWLDWYARRPAAMRDADGLELARAWWIAGLGAELAYVDGPSWKPLKSWLAGLIGERPPRDNDWIRWLVPVLNWLMALAPPPAAATSQWLLDAAETAMHTVPDDARRPHREFWGWGQPAIRMLKRPLVGPCGAHRRLDQAAWSPEQRLRLFQLQVWLGQPIAAGGHGAAARLTGKVSRLLAKVARVASDDDDDDPTAEVPRDRPEFADALAAFDAGAIGEADILDYLVGPAQGHAQWLHACTQRNLTLDLAGSPGLRPLVERACARLLDIELARGDRPTPATAYVKSISTVRGAATLLRILTSLGKDGFRRAAWGDESKGGVLSGVLRGCFPAETDTVDATADALRTARLPDQLLCDAALLAPQWAAHVGAALGWEGFESGVWWLYAHTKDNRWEMAEDIRSAWAAKVTEHTPLTSQDLLDGAVDVAWFGKVHATLGEQRFRHLYDAAKFGSSGTGHARAKLYADAMLGRAAADDLRARVTDKRNQDSLRALGLVPLPEGDAREPEVLARYEIIAEFQRTARQFGAQRQESEKRACAVALDNLARTAGYPDPLRLQWAMEARAVADLKAGPVTVTVGETSVALSISADGRPELTATKAGKALKSIPGPVGKDPAVAELKARKTSLDRAASRMKGALEQSMCRGDVFRGRELGDLLEHPLLAPSLTGLLWLGEGIAGYPAEGGRALRDHAGALHPLGHDEPVRLAHPVDLLAGGEWHQWQHECFAAQRVQPFKQIFRELYPLTQTEREESGGTRRYAGHQVQPRQALALLGGRGWVHDPEGGVRRTWHEAGLSAWIEFAEPFWTPAEVEGLTLESVHFAKRGEWQPVPLAEVPPIIFSEAMRDLDLVVSVAHRGGVDPEATASTVELRAMLLRELCALMGIENVRAEDRHVYIDGHFGKYSVHLGSAVTHKMPGGMLFIVPVHSQHRGRLFLPFADDDPKTAEVLSKVLMLARDEQIKDPSILSAIRG